MYILSGGNVLYFVFFMMNVYDFDKTIYDGDSTIDFYLYCLLRHPELSVYIFGQMWGVFLHKIGRIDTKELKERFFAFMIGVRDLDRLVESFWDSQESKIKGWYLKQRQDDDVVISASPGFLLAPICRRLGIASPIATELDMASGKILGANCKGKEKVRRFFERYPGAVIRRFYSDSLTDTPLAALAEEAFLVQGDRVIPWM